MSSRVHSKLLSTRNMFEKVFLRITTYHHLLILRAANVRFNQNLLLNNFLSNRKCVKIVLYNLLHSQLKKHYEKVIYQNIHYNTALLKTNK